MTKHYCNQCGERIKKIPSQCRKCHRLVHWEKKGIFRYEPVNNKLLTKEEAKEVKKDWKLKLEERYRKKGLFPFIKFKIFGESSQVDRRRRRATTEEMAEVFRRYGHRCIKCNTEYDLTVDHKIPLAKGGDWSMDNLQLLCRKCNSSKGAR